MALHTNHPPIPGLAKARNVYGFRNLSDAQQIHECVKEWKNIFVMGAGLVGMDVVAGLLVYGKKITLADMGPHMLPIQLDERSAGNYQRLFSQLGIEQFYKTGAKELMLDDAGFCTHVELSNGETIAVDAVINCAGVRPNVEFLSGTPLDLDRCGLAVDEFGRTNVQHVFGAGDVCGRSPIWPSAERQGMTAAYAMRTSVNWSRVFPTGSEEEPNEEGLLFYDCMIDAMVEQGLEPVLTVSHYEMPLALAMEHSGWHDRANIDKFVRCCQVLFDRHHDRVRRWILVNQINMVAHEGFNHLGVPTDETDDPLSARYQALHNEMVACARATPWPSPCWSGVVGHPCWRGVVSCMVLSKTAGSTITQTGQVSIPKVIRDILGVGPRDQVEFLSDGVRAQIVAVPKDPLTLGTKEEFWESVARADEDIAAGRTRDVREATHGLRTTYGL